jgi:hypothetical protein
VVVIVEGEFAYKDDDFKGEAIPDINEEYMGPL